MILAGEITMKHPKGIKILKRVVIRHNPISNTKVIAALKMDRLILMISGAISITS